jgi:hypothetical protein
MPGLGNVVFVYGESKQLPNGTLNPHVNVTATCPTGNVAIAGGAFFNVSGSWVVLVVPPTDGSRPTSWTSWVTNSSGGSLPSSANVVATAYAVCAAASQ